MIPVTGYKMFLFFLKLLYLINEAISGTLYRIQLACMIQCNALHYKNCNEKFLWVCSLNIIVLIVLRGKC